VTAIVGALQLDDNQSALFVDPKEIYASSGIFPIAVLLGDHHQIGVDGADVLQEELLQILSLPKMQLGKRRGGVTPDAVI